MGIQKEVGGEMKVMAAMIGRCEYCTTLFSGEDRRCFGCGAPLPLPASAHTPTVRKSLYPLQEGESLAWGYDRGHALLTWRI